MCHSLHGFVSDKSCKLGFRHQHHAALRRSCKVCSVHEQRKSLIVIQAEFLKPRRFLMSVQLLAMALHSLSRNSNSVMTLGTGLPLCTQQTHWRRQVWTPSRNTGRKMVTSKMCPSSLNTMCSPGSLLESSTDTVGRFHRGGRQSNAAQW